MSHSKPPSPPDPSSALDRFVQRVRTSSDPRAQLVRPPSDAEQDAATDRFLASIGQRRAPSAQPAPPALPGDATPEMPAPVPRPTARLLPFRRPRVLAALTTALAIAAAAVLAPRFLGRAPVATWTVRGDQASRSADAPGDERVIVRPDTVLRIAVALDRPSEELKVRLVVRRSERAFPAPAPRRLLEGNRLSLEQPADEMLGPQADGPAELVLIIGRDLPDEAEVLALALGQTRSSRWTVLVHPVVFAGWQSTGRLDPTGAPPALVDIAGCVSVLADGTCELGAERTLHVWAPGRSELLLDGAPPSVTTTRVGRGLRHDLSIPLDAKTLVIVIGDQRLSFTLRAAASSPELEAASQAMGAGRLDEAEKILAVAGGGPERAAAIAEARVLAKIRRRRALAGAATHAEAQAARLAVASRALAQGRLSEAADDRLAVAFSRMLDTRQLDQARALLDACEGDARSSAETRVLWEYYQGLYSYETGDFAAALDELSRARDRAERLGLGALGAVASEQLAEVLAELGRADEALSLLPSLEGRTGCARAAALGNRGWLRMLAGEVVPAAAELSAALEAAGEDCPAHRPTLALNLGYAAQARGAALEARRWLLASRAATRADDLRLRSWQDRLEIQLAMMDRPELALAAAERLALRAEVEGSAELRFEAAFGRARALEAQRRTIDAAGAYAQAEDLLDDWARTFRVGQGREGLAARLEAAPQASLAFQAERAEQAGTDEGVTRLAAAIVRSLSRWVRTLSPTRGPDARPLGAPAKEECWLLFHPLRTGVLGLSWSAEGKRLVRLASPAGDPALAAAELLRPFHAELGRAARVRLLLHRSFAGLPLGAVALADRLLAESTSLSFGLGLGGAAEPLDAGAGPRAIVVLDPRGDLPGARASTAAAELRARGFLVTELRGPSATRASLIALLRSPCPELLHYEGHGAHRGLDGQDAGLGLDGEELSVRDIRALPCVPRHVVLAACDTAHPSGMALAQAFVERGASAVLGAPAALPDALAASVMKRLYTSPSAAPAAFDLPSALASALGALRREGGDVRAAAALLRVMVP